MRHYFDFDGVKSSDYGVLISEENTFGAPARDVDEITVPGRDGNLTIDNGRFSAATHIYPAFIPETAKVNLAGLRNALMSKRGHRRLWDTLHADEFYKAYYEKGLEPEVTANLRHAALEIEFTRDPRRFLVSGENPQSVKSTAVTSSGIVATINNKSGYPGASVTTTVAPTKVIQTGKNILPQQPSNTRSNVTFKPRPDGGYDVYGTASGTNGFSIYTTSDPHAMKTGKKYYYAINVTRRAAGTSVPTIQGYISGTSIFNAANGSYTCTDEGTGTQQIRLRIGNGESYDCTVYPCMTVEDPDTTFEKEVRNIIDWDDYSGTISLLPGINNFWAVDGDVSVATTSAAEIHNPTLFPSKPLIRVRGQGTIAIGGMAITVTGSLPYIDIDTEMGDCYYGATNANQYVTFAGFDMPTLKPGSNYVSYTGFSAVEVTPRWWRL